MKFTSIIAALVSVVEAGQFAVPSIEWNVNKVNNITADIKAYGKRYQHDTMEDNKKNVESLSHAYATYKVGEYVIFGKYMKPIAAQNVAMMDEWTVDGSCDQNKAVECYNNFLLKGGYFAGYHNQNGTWVSTGEENKEVMERCVYKNASCAPHWESLSKADQ